MNDKKGEENIFRTEILPEQEWCSGKSKKMVKIKFDPDSSPKAWEHYKRFYINDFGKSYDIKSPCFFTSVFDKNLKGINCGYKVDLVGKSIWYNYVDSNKSDNNRLFAISDHNYREKKIVGIDVKFYPGQSRLGGETDFNFNHKHWPTLEEKLKKLDSPDSEKGLELLNECKEMHHTLSNFSLMQKVGNLQGFKGSYCDDRLDRFIYFLDQYYKTDILDRGNTCIAINASSENRESLLIFLNDFTDGTYDYCKKIYFIEGNFVDKLIDSGKEPIDSGERVVEYMNLANEFWNRKEKYFKEFNQGYCKQKN